MEVFLFPLVNITLFPRVTKPLHIFEPRYLEMINKAVEDKTPVALGFVEDPLLMTSVVPGEKIGFVKPVAGFGYVQIIEKRANDNLLIFIKGEGKISLGSLKKTGTPYMVCEAELIQEKCEIDESLRGSLSAIESILHRWVKQHVVDRYQQQMFMDSIVGPKEVIGSFASYLVEDYELQQLVLEMNDINEQIQFLIRLVGSRRTLS